MSIHLYKETGEVPDDKEVLDVLDRLADSMNIERELLHFCLETDFPNTTDPHADFSDLLAYRDGDSVIFELGNGETPSLSFEEVRKAFKNAGINIGSKERPDQQEILDLIKNEESY